MAGAFDFVIVGGGFYGACVATHLRRLGAGTVALLEAERQLLGRASYRNQARIHRGYHYPRSLLTALRSRINFPRFLDDYGDAVASRFDHFYAIGKSFSKVSASQFRSFCGLIGAPVEPAPDEIRRLFSPDLVEDVFAVEEYAFDGAILRERVLDHLTRAGVRLFLDCRAERLGASRDSTVAVECFRDSTPLTVEGRQVINCTYSRINKLLVESGLETIPLKHELAELALVRVPESLEGMGVTVMCGPFFSIMPFPAENLYSLSHVRYTPHSSWFDGEGVYRDPYGVLDSSPRRSNFPWMLRDAAKFLPELSGMNYVRSLWEVKSVLPMNEADDGRPILLSRDRSLENVVSILGSKLDNIYDVLAAITADLEI